jgi:hypothetical protein
LGRSGKPEATSFLKDLGNTQEKLTLLRTEVHFIKKALEHGTGTKTDLKTSRTE